MEDSVIIRRMAGDDAPGVAAVQAACSLLAEWTLDDYLAAEEKGITGWVAVRRASSGLMSDSREIVGFLVARLVADEFEILNLGVMPEQRRHGYAGLLLRAALDWAVDNGGRQAHLEVRASNLGAIAFYESFSFSSEGRRKDYYLNPSEDALRFSAEIPGHARE